MDFLKRLFGLSGGSGQAGGRDASGLYFYVRSNLTGEVVQVRLDRNNDLSLQDDYASYYARKIVVGAKSFQRMEAEFYFDKNRQLTAKEVKGGRFVDYEEYEAYLESERQKAEGDANTGAG